MRPAGGCAARMSACGSPRPRWRRATGSTRTAARPRPRSCWARNGGFVICDRYVGYHWADVLQQQLCWAHAIRQLVALSERHGAPGKLGRKLLDAAREVIKTHRRYLKDNHDLDWLRAHLAPLREQIQRLLEKGARGRDQKTANFCAGLLAEYDALWTFLATFRISRSRSPTTQPKERYATRSFSVAYRAAPNPHRAAGGSSGSSRSAKRCASKTAQHSNT